MNKAMDIIGEKLCSNVYQFPLNIFDVIFRMRGDESQRVDRKVCQTNRQKLILPVSLCFLTQVNQKKT